MGTHSQKHKTTKATKDFPLSTPNKKTIEAMKELDEGRGIHCSSLEEFWETMGMNPDA